MKPVPPPRGSVRASSLIVTAGMLLTAAAIGAALHVHQGLAAGPAIALAVVLGVMFKGMQTIWSHAQKVTSLGNELARLELEIERLKGRPKGQDVRNQFAVRNGDQTAPQQSESGKDGRTQDGAASTGMGQRPADQRVAVAEANAALIAPLEAPRSSPSAALNDAWAFRPAHPRFEDMPGFSGAPAPGSAALGAASSALAGPKLAPAAAAPSSGALNQQARGFDGFAKPHAPAPSNPALQMPPHAELPAASSGNQVPSLREADVEMIQGLIKKLADDVNATEILKQAVHGGAPAAARTAETSGAALASAAIDASVDALRRTAKSMVPQPNASLPHQPHHQHQAPQQPAAQLRPALHPETYNAAAVSQPVRQTAPAPQSQSPAQVVRSEFYDAIAAGRVDVLLEPIIGLGDLRARHYEVSLRISDKSGEGIEAGPGNPLFAGSGLLPLLDRARLDRTASVARRLDQRGKGGAVMSEYSRDSLTDREFLLGAKSASDSNPGVSSQLVLSFSQGSVRHLSETQWAALSALRSIGFRFGVQDVTDLDMDFARLANAGFAFVKLDSDVFLDGLRAPHGVIPAGDICRHLAGMGFTLIVGRIDDESERARLFGFGVLFGQGQLFGGPRPMKADSLARTEHRAA